MEEEATKIQKQTGQRGWYVIHTYAGYEDQVAENIRQRVESMNMKEMIFDVKVPTEKRIEIRAGKKEMVEKKIFPGYVMVDMIVTDESWYVVRNTPNVTGFIGLGVRPTAMSQEEIERLEKRMSAAQPRYDLEFSLGELVRVIDGALKGMEGKIIEIDKNKGKLKVSVLMFGRETPMSLDFAQIKKV
ncbi:MAG: transcription antitermination factor [Candidatus Berkelbacteria bacterium Licking1014_2]|uniref:Transcription termination/antitermination protein NusG n=1 Tax=Candidatus Berkelbacteria bacterium Licking1014_2 TaxID=2017146 RepID=A0A554LW27_9BACT|nr:MAG: transcription antitermination factor [Candidatus Berkelbacteria bacterium Licking1014_2]